MFSPALFVFLTFLQLAEGNRRTHQYTVAAGSAPAPALFNYFQHGDDWVQNSCKSRARQSPVDFEDYLAPPSGKLSYFYKVLKKEFDIGSDGQSLTGNFAGRGVGGITYDKAHYELLHVNFHSLSEHTFDGKHHPVEMQLVHKKEGSDQLLFVAIPIDSPTPITGAAGFLQRANRSSTSLRQNPVLEKIAAGPYFAPNPEWPSFNVNLQSFLWTALPNMDEIVKAPINEAAPLDLNTFLEGGNFLEYSGSLTAPPCSEVVTWFVRRNPIMASDQQIVVLHDELFRMTSSKGNYRTATKLNGRPLTVKQAVKEKPEIEPHDPSIPIGPNPRTDNEQRAMEWAQGSLKIAKAARDYVNDLDNRMQAAAIAHANALAPDLMPENPQPIGAKAGTPPPPPPVDLTKQSEEIAASIAKAAKDAIFDAAQRISVEATAAAASAAKEATKIAQSGGQNLPGGLSLPGAPAAAAAV